MNIVTFIVLMFVVVFFIAINLIFSYVLNRPLCPRCNTRLVSIQSFNLKKNISKSTLGLICPKCGCKCDFKGHELIGDEDKRAFQKAYTKKTLFRAVVIILVLFGTSLIASNFILEPQNYISNSDVCEQTVSTVYADECYFDLAIKNNDVSLCAEIGDSYIPTFDKSSCYWYFINQTQNENLCNRLLLNEKDGCFFDIAVAKKNAALCYNINPDNNFYRSQCLKEAS